MIIFVYLLLTFTGTAFSPFALHIEDKGLSSINYGHWGAHKKWFGVAQEDYNKVVTLLMRFVYFHFGFKLTFADSTLRSTKSVGCTTPTRIST